MNKGLYIRTLTDAIAKAIRAETRLTGDRPTGVYCLGLIPIDDEGERLNDWQQAPETTIDVLVDGHTTTVDIPAFEVFEALRADYPEATIQFQSDLHTCDGDVEGACVSFFRVNPPRVH